MRRLGLHRPQQADDIESVLNTSHLIPTFRKKVNIITVTASVCGALLLIPLTIPIEALKSNKEESQRDANYRSDLCRSFAIVALALCAAQLFELSHDFRKTIMKRALFTILRCACLLTLAVYAILYIASKDFEEWMQFQKVVGNFQVFIELSISLWLLNSVDVSSLWGSQRVSLILATFFLALVFDYVHFVTLSTALLCASCSMLLIGVLIWAYVCRDLIQSSFNLSDLCSDDLPTSIKAFYSLIVVSTLSFGIFFELFSIAIISRVLNLSFYDVFDTSYYRACSIFNRAVVSYLLTVLPSRLYKTVVIEEYVAEVKSAFVGYISHEIRNPMQVLAVGLELLQVQHATGAINKAVGNTHELINASIDVQELLDNMLLYERIDRGTLTVNMVQTPVIDFLSRTFRDLRINIDIKSQIDLLPNFAQDILDYKSLLINIDQALVASLFRQMYSRASRGSTSSDIVVVSLSGVRVLVELEASDYPYLLRQAIVPSDEKCADRIRISMSVVQSLSAEESRQFFTSRLNFMREAHENGEGGFKLSAWILSQVAELHGGLARRTDSSPSVLHLDLPFTRSECSGENEARMLSDLSAARLSLQADLAPPIGFMRMPLESRSFPSHKIFPSGVIPDLKVLVVDDAKSNRKMLIRLMDVYGHHCIEAENGKIAEELVKSSLEQGEEPFDLVLLDNEMPVMTGVESARMMRMHGFEGIILGVTANVLLADITEFKSAGVDEVIFKPLTAIKFKNVMEGLAEKKRHSF